MSVKLKINTQATLGELVEKQSPIKESQLIRVLIKKKKSEKAVKNHLVFSLIKLSPDASFKQTVAFKDEPPNTVRDKFKFNLVNINNISSSPPSKNHRALSARNRVFSSNQISFRDSQMPQNFRHSSRFAVRNFEILNFLRNKNKYFPKKIVIKRKIA
ncbi:hypothetical protein SteCoe_24992 [Stentor coeruleus]|uniref:Uncharacterized protein n=1 Tax=Stentor coeruleus TaxID=5963 RepID=A0A1R2BGA3_9CILI|nr:hypothetical protein SteCoe_24992 [Stentor coeruleus]